MFVVIRMVYLNYLFQQLNQIINLKQYIKHWNTIVLLVQLNSSIIIINQFQVKKLIDQLIENFLLYSDEQPHLLVTSALEPAVIYRY